MPWRRATAFLLAGIAVILALATTAGDARAMQRDVRHPDYEGCPLQYVCLWEHAYGQGRLIYFKAYGTYKLSRWGMSGDPVHHKGVTSFWNHQSGGAKATLIGPNFRLNISNYGNVPASLNDRATYVRLSP